VRRHPQGLSRPARSRTCWPSADHRRAASSQRRRWCCSMPPIGAFRNDRSASTSLPLHPPDTRPRHAFSCCQRFWNDHQSTSVAIGLGSHVQSGGHKRTLSSVTPRPTLTLSARNGQSGSTGSNLRSWMQMRAEVKSKKMTPYQSNAAPVPAATKRYCPTRTRGGLVVALPGGAYTNSASRALACFKSKVSKPSVNHP